MLANRDTCVRELCCLAELECVTNPVEFGWVVQSWKQRQRMWSWPCWSRRGHNFSEIKNLALLCAIRSLIIPSIN